MSEPDRPRTKPAETRRDELLAAAEALFVAQGVEATTIDQVTRDASVAKGTFYLYFKSKEDVRAALAERLAARQIAAAQPTFPSATWAQRLEGWVEAGAGFHLDSARLIQVIGMAVDAPVVEDLTALLAGGAEAGAWRLDDARATAAFIVGGLRLLADDARTQEKRVIRSRLARRAQKLALRAVGLDD